jgi:very-short-patch-repair endonuclease
LQTEEEEKMLNKKRSKKAERKYKTRQRLAKVETALEEQFQSGRLLGMYFKFVIRGFINFNFYVHTMMKDFFTRLRLPWLF